VASATRPRATRDQGYTLALTSCLPNVVFVKPDEDADKFTAAWWAAKAAAVEKKVRQKAVEVDLEETKETKVAEDVTEENEGSDDASSRPVLPYTGFLPYKAVYEYVRQTGRDYASGMSYCPHAIAAIGAAIEYDVSALIVEATAKAEKEREELLPLKESLENVQEGMEKAKDMLMKKFMEKREE